MASEELLSYLKGLNPVESDETEGLFYGAKYNCYKDGEFIGIYTWTKDQNIGDSFQQLTSIDGEELISVGIPDKWTLLPDEDQ